MICYFLYGLHINKILEKKTVYVIINLLGEPLLMEKVTLLNMPEDTLFKFQEGGYIWKKFRTTTREGNVCPKPTPLYEVFRVRDDNLSFEWSGTLVVSESSKFSETSTFSLYSADMEGTVCYTASCELTQAVELQRSAEDIEKDVQARLLEVNRVK